MLKSFSSTTSFACSDFEWTLCSVKCKSASEIFKVNGRGANVNLFGENRMWTINLVFNARASWAAQFSKFTGEVLNCLNHSTKNWYEKWFRKSSTSTLLILDWRSNESEILFSVRKFSDWRKLRTSPSTAITSKSPSLRSTFLCKLSTPTTYFPSTQKANAPWCGFLFGFPRQKVAGKWAIFATVSDENLCLSFHPRASLVSA